MQYSRYLENVKPFPRQLTKLVQSATMVREGVMTVGLPVYRVTNADLVVPSDVLGNDTPNLQTLDAYDDSIAALQAAGYPSVQAFTTTAAASMTFAFPMSMLLAGVSGGSNPFGPLVWPGGWVKALIKNDASQTMQSSSLGFNDTVGG